MSADAPAPRRRQMEDEPWWAELLEVKDQYTLRELAERFGVTPANINEALKRNGIARRAPPAGSPAPEVRALTEQERGWVQPYEHLLGTMPDAQLAETVAVPVEVIGTRRRELGIQQCEHAVEDLAAAESALQAAAKDTHAFSDGRQFEPELVAREIHHYTGTMLLCAYEIGKRLIWAKAELPHGQFGNWCGAHFDFNHATRARYMKVALRLQRHPKLLEPLARVGLKKALLLTTMPDDELEQLVEDGQLGGVSLEELGDKSYTELKDALQREERRSQSHQEEAASQEARAERLEKQLRAAKDRLAEFSGVMPPEDEDQVLERLERLHRTFDGVMLELGVGMDAIARRFNELSAAAQARARGLLEYTGIRCEYELVRFSALGGEFVPGAAFDEIEGRERPDRDRYPVPDSRTLPTFGDEGGE